METPSMTEDDVRAAANRLVQFHERFAPLFGKEQAQDHAFTYVKGLMVCPERKSIEPIALSVGDGQVSALQKFINSAPWDHDDVQAEIHAVFADELVPTAAAGPTGVVGVVDASGVATMRDHSAGVPRQYLGRLRPRPRRAAVAAVAAVAAGLSRPAWRTRRVRQGAKGPLAFEFAAVRVWAVRHGGAGPPVWLVVRRSLEPVPEVKYYVSNADA